LVHIGILKTIPVWLALIDGCSEMVFHISRMLSGGEAYLWQMPQLYGSAVIGIVVVLAGLFLIFVVCIRRTRNRNKEKRP
jgi:heme/copper-type cytochrome/quinol oxidase subunit 2